VAASRTLEQTAERFAAVGTTALIITKLDEANGLGNLLPVLRLSRMPVSYLTNGQNVPDDIEIADSPRLAKLILGLENDNRSGDRQWQWQIGGNEQSNSILQS
jgi:flagellar biosynthesis protein FlhF